MRKKKKAHYHIEIISAILGILIIGIIQVSLITDALDYSFSPDILVNKKLKKYGIRSIDYIKSNNDRLSLMIHYTHFKGERNQPNLIFSSSIATFSFKHNDYKMHFTEERNKYRYDFFIPIEDTYNITIVLNKITVLNFLHTINDTSHIRSDFSTMRCFGKDFNDRYCELNNTCYEKKKFIFFTNLTTVFHSNIVYPGSRPIPHDYPSCRNAIRLIANNEPMTKYKFINEFTERSFVTCRWYGMQHLWHTLFDFTVPVWWAQNEFGGHKDDDRIFLIDENTNMKKGFLFKEMLTNEEIINIRINSSYANKTCFKHAIIGVPKTELVVTPEKWKNGFLLPYEYRQIAFKGFREQAIAKYVPNKSYCERTKKPRIVLINRATPARYIVNGKELFNKMKEWCDECDFSYTLMENVSMGEQIEELCNASMLISIHGSGLSHMVWMRNEKNAIIEIFPYKYNCRDWYQQVAESYGLNYFSWINTNKSNTQKGRKGRYKECIEEDDTCLNEKCHEMLRDQPTIVDYESFRKVFNKALKTIL